VGLPRHHDRRLAKENLMTSVTSRKPDDLKAFNAALVEAFGA
jgi:pyruvoyl-dependent arginine decarboxylase (PvlArgDC)